MPTCKRSTWCCPSTTRSARSSRASSPARLPAARVPVQLRDHRRRQREHRRHVGVAAALAASSSRRCASLRLDRKGRGRALRAAWLASGADSSPTWTSTSRPTSTRFLPLVAPLALGSLRRRDRHPAGAGARVRRGAEARGDLARLQPAPPVPCSRAGFRDAQCGFKARPRRRRRGGCCRCVEDDAWFFDTELLLLAERNGLRIHEVPVDWVEDLDSRVDLRPDDRRDLAGLWRVRRAFWRGGAAGRPATARGDAMSAEARRRRRRARGGRRVARELALSRSAACSRSRRASTCGALAERLREHRTTRPPSAACSQSWHNFFFGSFDPGGLVIGRQAAARRSGSQAAQREALRLLGLYLLLPEALAGVARGRGSCTCSSRASSAAVAGLVAGARARRLARVASPSTATTTRTRCSCSCSSRRARGAAGRSRRGRCAGSRSAPCSSGSGSTPRCSRRASSCPALALAYLGRRAPRRRPRLAPGRRRRRVLLVVSRRWVAAVDLTPAGRPAVRRLEHRQQRARACVLGYNGLGRVTGQEGGTSRRRRRSAAPSRGRPACFGCSTTRSATRAPGCRRSRSSAALSALARRRASRSRSASWAALRRSAAGSSPPPRSSASRAGSSTPTTSRRSRPRPRALVGVCARSSLWRDARRGRVRGSRSRSARSRSRRGSRSTSCAGRLPAVASAARDRRRARRCRARRPRVAPIRDAFDAALAPWSPPTGSPSPSPAVESLPPSRRGRRRRRP